MDELGTSSRPLRRKEAAEYITKTFNFPCSPKTLARLASVGGSPAYRKVGPYPLYATEDLDAWVMAKTGERVTATSQASEAA